MVSAEEKKRLRKQFSVIGWSLFTLYAFMLAFGPYILDFLVFRFAPHVLAWGGYYIVRSYISVYLIGLPLALLILRSIPDRAVKLERKPVKAGRFLLYLFSGYTLTYIISLIGTYAIAFITRLMGFEPANPLQSAFETSGLLVYAIIVVGIAPVMEEFIFRRLIFKKTAAYGPRLYMFFSAAVFGLYHGNLFQIFYAFVLGLVMTRLCWRMGGSIVQSWFFHFLINLISTVPLLLPNVGLQVIWILGFVIAGIPCGIVLLVKLRREKKLRQPSESDIPSPPASLAFANAGMIAYYLITGFVTVLSLLGY